MKIFKLTILYFLFQAMVSSLATGSSSYLQVSGQKNRSKAASDTSEVNRYIKTAFQMVSKPKYFESMKANIDSAESICVDKNLEFPPLLHLVRAEYFSISGDFKNAYLDATIALKKSKNAGETKVIAYAMNFLGRYSLRTGFYKEGIDYFNNSITLAKKIKMKGIIPKNLYDLKNIYDSLALHDQKAYRSTLKMLIDAATLENDTAYLEAGYYYLGTSMTEKVRDFNGADSLLNKCLEIALIKKDTNFTVLCLANLGWNLYLEKKYDSAIKYYNKSLLYSIPGKRYAYSANALGNLGTIYRDIHDTEKSIKYYQKSIDQAKIVEDVYDLSWVYMDMSEMFLRKRDTANAYINYVLFKRYSDMLIRRSNSKGLTDARLKYDADTHNKELELLSLKLRNQKLLIYGYTGLFLLSLAIGILLLGRARINAKRRISDMNRKISEVTQANLRQQMNPHFIFNTLNSIQYYMYQHDKLATNNYLTKFSSLMRKVLENSQHTAVPLRDELDALNLYLDLETIRFKDKFEYKISIDEEIDTLLYKVPTMLIQPYVENSICHGLMPSEGKGLIKIDIKLENDYISCTIEDNGIGREAALEKRNKSENNYNSLGTRIVTSRLDLVNALYGTSLKTIYTDLKNENGEPEGTKVEIHIPIMT